MNRSKYTSGFVVLGISLFSAGLALADSYSVLLKRYEKQIHQQERQLKGLNSRLDEKERDVTRWQNKAEQAKTAWSQSSVALSASRDKIKQVQASLQKSRLLADAAQWKSTENVLIARSALAQAQTLAQDLYIRSLVPDHGVQSALDAAAPQYVLNEIASLSRSSQVMADEGRREELAMRTEEMRWQTEAQSRAEEADQLHQKQESEWLKWQEALRRKATLQDEIAEIDQSAKALQVMLQELQDHREQAKALHDNRSVNDQALASLRGTLPWPAQGKVVQNFGRQYPDGLNQLVVSNGVKIDAGPSHTVRTIQEGKVLFASPFRQYGQLVIVQHKNGLTSVYAGLGQTQVQPGQDLAALDQIGLTGDSGSFYFELRRDEQPINPLVYLAPASNSEISSRRTFQ
jgi:septal ring factor EnvC (AmiA/AmiB activator)